jgi:hypothetical protein
MTDPLAVAQGLQAVRAAHDIVKGRLAREAAFFCLASATALRAQVPLAIDLSNVTPAESVLPAGSSFRVTIKNRPPSSEWQYVVQTILMDQEPPPPLVLAGVLTDSKDGRAFLWQPELDKACIPVMHVAAALDSASDELSLPGLIRDARKVQMDQAAQGACPSRLKSLQAMLDATTYVAQEGIQVPEGQDLLVTITRTKARDANVRPKIWVLRYTGRPRGEWVTTYGFAFITDWPFGAANETFHVDATSDPTKFIVRQDAAVDRVRFAPTIFFAWHPRTGKWYPSFCLAISGGLGFDLSNPVVTAGPTVVHNSNLSFHFGLVAAKVDRLLPRYAAGDTVGESLTPEQLRSSVYRINPFVAVSFRFCTNPFAGAGSVTRAIRPRSPGNTMTLWPSQQQTSDRAFLGPARRSNPPSNPVTGFPTGDSFRLPESSVRR